MSKGQKDSTKRSVRDTTFPFLPNQRYPVTQVSQFPLMPKALHMVWGDMYLCYQVLMTDDLYHGVGNKCYDFRLDEATVLALGGLLPDKDHDPTLEVRRQIFADGRHPNDRQTKEADRLYDIELVRDGLHPLELIGSEAIDYFAMVQTVFRTSTVFLKPNRWKSDGNLDNDALL